MAATGKGRSGRGTDRARRAERFARRTVGVLHQLFAAVTNPRFDPIRVGARDVDRDTMGPAGNTFGRDPEQCIRASARPVDRQRDPSGSSLLEEVCSSGHAVRRCGRSRTARGARSRSDRLCKSAGTGDRRRAQRADLRDRGSTRSARRSRRCSRCTAVQHAPRARAFAAGRPSSRPAEAAGCTTSHARRLRRGDGEPVTSPLDTVVAMAPTSHPRSGRRHRALHPRRWRRAS